MHSRMPTWAKILIVGVPVIVVGVIVIGFFHIVTDDMKFCSKESWGLTGTFVSMEDFDGRSRIELMDRMLVVRALENCGVLMTRKQQEVQAIVKRGEEMTVAIDQRVAASKKARVDGDIRTLCSSMRALAEMSAGRPGVDAETQERFRIAAAADCKSADEWDAATTTRKKFAVISKQACRCETKECAQEVHARASRNKDEWEAMLSQPADDALPREVEAIGKCFVKFGLE